MSTPVDLKHGCRWDYVCGPNRGGAVPRTMVWICEYPYRTVRLDGPCDDCKCPADLVSCVGGDGAAALELTASTVQNEASAQRRVAGPRVLPFRDNR